MFRPRRSISAGLLPLSCLLFCAATPSLAQSRDPKLDGLAAQLIANASSKLRRGHDSPDHLTCLVMDFEEPNDAATRLGVGLADEFSQALGRMWPETTVLDRAKFGGALSVTRMGKNESLLRSTVSFYAPSVGANVVVVGQISEEDKTLNLRLRLLDAAGKNLAEASERLELTDARRALEKLKPRDRSSTSPWPGIPTAGQDGYAEPKCISCPQAPYTEEARNARAQAMVLLDMLIGEDGNVREVSLVRGAPFGLGEQALSTTRKWRFEPVLGPDGRPTATQIPVEMRFLLLSGNGLPGTPHCISCPHPPYTKEARKARIEGTVKISARIAEDGHVEDVVVEQGLPGGLTEKTVDAVKKWRFTPFVAPDGRGHSVELHINIVFNLSKD